MACGCKKRQAIAKAKMVMSQPQPVSQPINDSVDVGIITRAYNRLEYTAQVIGNVRNVSNGVSYRHVIVDNNSSDGTKEWIAWLKQNTDWYNNLIYTRLPVNAGDWGGMVAGYNLIKNAKYIVQLDNDILVPEGWLTSMIDVLENSQYQVVMLRRENVEWKLKPLSPVFKISNCECAKVERAVACYMMKNETFQKVINHVPSNQGSNSKYIMAHVVNRSIVKILNVTCREIESPFQREKYKPSNPNVYQKT
jgi:glycosyltransferase involved in cell wall biosynthesis